MEKKNVVFLTVLAIATLLTAVIGTTFAYFTASVSGNGDANATVITTANNLGITYSDGANVTTGSNITPGWSATKTISVTNNSTTSSASYEINWASVTNGFAKGTNGTAENTEDDTDDLVYTITKVVSGSKSDYYTTAPTGVANTKVYTTEATRAHSTEAGKAAVGSGTAYFAVVMPATGATDKVAEGTLAAGATDQYELTFMFLETGIEQNENTNKSFTGTLQATLKTSDGVHVN